MAQTRAIGSIEVQEKLSTRESGEFYLGRQPGVDRPVVLRKLRADLLSNPLIVERFRREARLGARVVHPNVLGVYDLFASRGDHYLVLEHVDGPSLREVFEWRRAMRPGIVARVGLELARGLAELHDRGIIHADLRPENIRVGRWGEIKLSGFAYAREASETEPPAPPPESPYSGPVNGPPQLRDDVRALGVVLHEMLRGSTTEERAEWQPRTRSTRLERTLVRLIERCTSEATNKRPSAGELASRLEAAQPRLSGPETRNEIAAWLVQARRGEPDTPPPHEPDSPPAPRRALPQSLRSLGRPAASALAGILLLVGGAWLWRALPDATRAPSETGRSIPTVDAGVGDEPASVRFAVHPWAEIQVDDLPPFLTPRAEPLELAPGRHRVEFRHPTLGSASRVMELAPGAETVIRHVFPAAERP